MSIPEEDLRKALAGILLKDDNDDEGVVDGIDGDIVSYLAGMLHEGGIDDVEDQIGPFLEGYGCDEDLISKACKAVTSCANGATSSGKTTVNGDGSGGQKDAGAVRLKQGLVSMSSALSEQTDAEIDANRFMWGQDNKIAAMTNQQRQAHETSVSAKDKRKQRKELESTRREYESKMAFLAAEEEGDAGKASVSHMVLPDYRSGRNEKDIWVRNVSLSLDNGKSLLDDGELKFSHQRRYGLVGKNGVGKTTLLKAIAAFQVEGFPRHHRILHVRQEIRAAGGSVSVLQAVMDADVERNTLMEEEKELLKRLEKEGGRDVDAVDIKEKLNKLKARSKAEEADEEFNADLKRLDEVYERLQIIGSDSAESKAAMILTGLQFTPEMQSGPTSALSGGWRMRVALAAALFIEPDLLMLDEPTNHLDLEAVLWLESYLQSYRHTVIIVSHDRSFLNEVCTDTIEFKNRKLTYYKGDYDTYVKTSEENIKNSMRVYQAYQDKRAHMMEFIDKFRCSAARAKLVQSRIKTVEKMDLEAPEPIVIEQLWRFAIPNPEPLGRPIISIDDVWFDYTPVDEATGSKKSKDEWILQKVNFGVDLDSRMGILGANGAGKSTLLNLIMDRLTPISGSISRNSHLRIGHFTQHSSDKFDLQLSAVENMLNLFEDAEDQSMRSFLGRFQIQGTDALKPMMLLSGGQKSRVAFASLAYQKPHVIIMDEPTNHLDMESIDALVEAVKDFRGGLLVVSHDQYFITNTCGELWVVGSGKVSKFRGDFNDYKKETLERTAKRVADSVKSLSTINK
mmetsp:Transcript_5236/g.11489  ORF Transcript_5236/g.11489 Transcript_5236/m.11489 type:complete len:794 (-) Transcript_5236:362-2743(-)